MKKLPIGIQSIEKILGTHDYVYPTFRTKLVLDSNLAFFQLDLQILWQYWMKYCPKFVKFRSKIDKSKMK